MANTLTIAIFLLSAYASTVSPRTQFKRGDRIKYIGSKLKYTNKIAEIDRYHTTDPTLIRIRFEDENGRYSGKSESVVNCSECRFIDSDGHEIETNEDCFCDETAKDNTNEKVRNKYEQFKEEQRRKYDQLQEEQRRDEVENKWVDTVFDLHAKTIQDSILVEIEKLNEDRKVKKDFELQKESGYAGMWQWGDEIWLSNLAEQKAEWCKQMNPLRWSKELRLGELIQDINDKLKKGDESRPIEIQLNCKIAGDFKYPKAPQKYENAYLAIAYLRKVLRDENEEKEKAKKSKKLHFEKKNVSWMYDDSNPYTNTLAKKNPIRWSWRSLPQKVLDDLRNLDEKNVGRPIILDVDGDLKKFSSTQKAIDLINDSTTWGVEVDTYDDLWGHY